MTLPPPSLPDLEAAIAQALCVPTARVLRLELAGGQVVWFKRAETLQGLMRLQKGDSRLSFEREREALRLLNQQKLPVAPLIAEGPDWFVTPDIGETLRAHMHHPHPDSERAFSAAGAALAQLHRAGFSHGRPAIRDICWNGEEARFIDLERFRPKARSRSTLALDVLIFTHSLYTEASHNNLSSAAYEAMIEAALTRYAEEAPEIWAQTQRLASKVAWLAPLARRIRSREFQAVTPTLERLRPSSARPE